MQESKQTGPQQPPKKANGVKPPSAKSVTLPPAWCFQACCKHKTYKAHRRRCVVTSSSAYALRGFVDRMRELDDGSTRSTHADWKMPRLKNWRLVLQTFRKVTARKSNGPDNQNACIIELFFCYAMPMHTNFIAYQSRKRFLRTKVEAIYVYFLSDVERQCMRYARFLCEFVRYTLRCSFAK